MVECKVRNNQIKETNKTRNLKALSFSQLAMTFVVVWDGTLCTVGW